MCWLLTAAQQPGCRWLLLDLLHEYAFAHFTFVRPHRDHHGSEEMTYRIAYLGPTLPWLHDLIRSEMPPGFALDPLLRGDHAEMEDKVAAADFVVALKVDADLVARMQKVRLIQYHGVGYHKSIDIPACQAAGIPVAFTPDGNTIEVAEHVIMDLLTLYRKLITVHNALRQGKWLMWELREGMFNLCGKTVGIIGFGRIGRETARKLKPFDVNLLYHDICQPTEDVEQALAASYRELPDLLRVSDAVVLCVPGTAATRNLISKERLALMKPSAILVNVARGDVVDEDAMITALQNGKLAGAALDVFCQEPLSPDSPLLRLDNVILTPHVGSGTVDSLRSKARGWFANFERITRGEKPENLVFDMPAGDEDDTGSSDGVATA
jgi:phosphoglycerate dehydrogenase-like enzyme